MLKTCLIYEPVSRGVVQLDGTTVKSVGLVKDLSMTLHVCPNFVIPQDMYIADLPPHFSICLSRGFTTKLGGYISVDWLHLFFRTQYGTKVTIKSESQTTCHLEPYTPIPINADLAVRDHDELPPIQDPHTLVQGIPDVKLDEWAAQTTIEFPFIKMDGIGLGVYMIHEEDVVIPKLENEDVLLDQQSEQQKNQVWQLYFDSSRGKKWFWRLCYACFTRRYEILYCSHIFF